MYDISSARQLPSEQRSKPAKKPPPATTWNDLKASLSSILNPQRQTYRQSSTSKHVYHEGDHGASEAGDHTDKPGTSGTGERTRAMQDQTRPNGGQRALEVTGQHQNEQIVSEQLLGETEEWLQDQNAIVALPKNMRKQLDLLLQSWKEHGQQLDHSPSVSWPDDDDLVRSTIFSHAAAVTTGGLFPEMPRRSKSLPTIVSSMLRHASFTHSHPIGNRPREPEAADLMLTGAEMAKFLGLIARLDDRTRSMPASANIPVLPDALQLADSQADILEPIDLAELDYDEDLIALYDSMTTEEKYYKKCGDLRVLEDRVANYEWDHNDALSHRTLMKDQGRETDISDAQFEAQAMRQREAFNMRREILEKEVKDLWDQVQEEGTQYTVNEIETSQSPGSTDIQAGSPLPTALVDQDQKHMIDRQPVIDIDALVSSLTVKPRKRVHRSRTQSDFASEAHISSALDFEDIASGTTAVELEVISQETQMNVTPPPSNMDSVNDLVDTWQSPISKAGRQKSIKWEPQARTDV